MTTPRKLRVVQVVNTLAVADGGPARHSLDVNAALNARDDCSAQLVWLTGAPSESLLAAGVPAGVDTKTSRARVGDVWRAVGNADVVVIHGFYLFWVPLIASISRRRGRPYVVMPHGVFTRYQRQQSRPKKRLFDLLAGAAVRRKAAAFVVATETERSELAEAYPAANVAVVGAGTSTIEETATGDRHSPVRLLSLSRIAPKKRIDVAIDAVHLLRTRGVDARLTVAGSGPPELTRALEEQTKRLGIEDRVIFAGEVHGQEKSALLSSSDIFLAPSEDENFGISVAEALAHGVPIVATRFVSAALPAAQVGGRVIDAVDAGALADAVAELCALDDFPDLRASAITVASEHYGWATVASRWRAALDEAALGDR